MIREAVPGDAADLARVHVTTWQAAYRGLIAQEFLDSLDIEARTSWWETTLQREGNRVTVGVTEGSVEGFCLFGASSDEGWGEIYAIYVSPGHWGTGLGRELLIAGESGLAGEGHHRALLWVLDTNQQARRFYERQGWSLGKPFRVESIGGFDVNEVRYEKRLERL